MYIKIPTCVCCTVIYIYMYIRVYIIIVNSSYIYIYIGGVHNIILLYTDGGGTIITRLSIITIVIYYIILAGSRSAANGLYNYTYRLVGYSNNNKAPSSSDVRNRLDVWRILNLVIVCVGTMFRVSSFDGI